MSKITRPCKLCGKVFSAWERPGSAEPSYCSRQCWLKVHNNPERNATVARETAEQRADAQRDRGRCVSYRKMRGRHEHRRVAEQMVGRPLQSDEIVHHIDHNKRNNAPENLKVLTRREHILEHLPAMHAANRAKRGGAR